MFYHDITKIFNSLLNVPSTNDSQNFISRKNCNYQFNDNPFIIKTRSYEQQYSGIYYCRLKKLYDNVKKACDEKWRSSLESGKVAYKSKILDVQQGKLNYVIGTIFIDMPNKPNILKEVSQNQNINEESQIDKYYGTEDIILIEDESGRMTITGDVLKSDDIVTGIVIGVLGSENNHGEFEILDYCLPGLPEQIPRSINNSNETKKYVALISGLEIGNEMYKPLETQLMLEFLTGELGCLPEQKHSSEIVRIIIAGNLISKYKRTDEEIKNARLYGHFECKSLSDQRQNFSQLDMLLSTISSCIPIDIMPGENEPTNLTYPQQPIHKSLLMNTMRSDTCVLTTNPHYCEIDNLQFLGTSGQNINDLMKYHESNNQLEIAERTLKWQHIAPSAPDTLCCYPFKDDDPFVIETLPHVYFVGNQDKFSEKLIEEPNGKKAKIIMIPSFIKTHQIILLDLTNLECLPMKFNTQA